jgi:tetratricopeptide (TPR) repeat protein
VVRLRRLWSTAFPPEDLTAPAYWPQIDGYEIRGVLGRGGLGVVYRARQRDLGREVAVKMIAAGERSSPEDVRRLLHDAVTAAQLHHERIVPVHAVGQYRGLPYCVMELIGGGSLAGRVADLVHEPRETARLIAAAAGALHHAHRQGVLHRDVKPANILLRVRDPQPTVARPPLADLDACVSDFGLAKQTEGDASLSISGAVVGTPGYMAPEQIRSTKLTPATDVYGLGAVLYECLTGQPPLRAATPFDTLLLTLHREPERPRVLNSRLHRDLETICLKCLEKEPARRYPSAAVLADDLQRWLQGQPVRARRVGPGGRLWRWARRRAVTASLAAALLLALVGGLSTGLVLWRESVANEAQAVENLAREEMARREAEEHYATLRQLMTNHVHVNNVWQPWEEDPNPLPETMLRDAESCLSGLLERRPEDQPLRVLLAEVLTHLGMRQQTNEEAVRYLETAVRLWEQVPRGVTQEPRQRAARATTYGSLSMAYSGHGRRDLALECAETSLALWTPLAADCPTPRYQEGFFGAAHRVGQLLVQLDRSDAEIARQFAILRDRPLLLGSDRGCATLLDMLRVERWLIVAAGHYRAGDSAAWLTVVRQAAAILQPYYDPATRDPTACVRLASDATQICICLRQAGAVPEALAFAERIARAMEELIRQRPEDHRLYWALSGSWEQIGKSHWRLDHVPETVDAYRHAVETQRQACLLAPWAAEHRNQLGWRYLQLGRKLCELDRLDEAEACFRDRQALWPGDEAIHAKALQELHKWAGQVGDPGKRLSPAQRRERQRYLDLYARLEGGGPAKP